MIFNSFTYLFFLIGAVSLYWTLPRTPRLLMLLVASLVFYGFWRVDFALLLVASIVTDYGVALGLDRLRGKAARRALLSVSICINLGLLGFFKYFYFLAENSFALASAFGFGFAVPTWEILLPVGISFYTFQTLSYTIDVYRGFTRAERDFLLFANFVAYFPQLVAGPILRANEVIWQLDRRPVFSAADISAGIQRIIAGLFLKVVLADNIATLVNDGFGNDPALLSALDVSTLAVLFGFQIYFDFSGYSHIALGSARLMGIHFPENFDYPYISASPRAFWRRWHISLSSWIRDYLYLPLAGARVEDRSTGGLASAARAGRSHGRAYFALFATWAIMGLWHGAAWTFVIWGLWHAILIALYRVCRPVTSRLPAAVQTVGGWLWTFPMVMLAWIPFRAHSMTDAGIMLGRLTDPSAWTWLGLRENNYLVAFLVLVLVVLAPYAHASLERLRPGATVLGRMAYTAGLAIAVAMVLVYLRPLEQFIYFQF